MSAVRIARQVKLGEARLPLAAGHRPENVFDVLPGSGGRLSGLSRSGEERAGRLGVVSDSREERADIGGVRPIGVAIEIGFQQVRVAVLSGQAPELRLDRLIGGARPGEIELPGEQRFVGGNLLSSGRGENVVADRDHHARDVGARRRQMGEKGGGERTVAALAVESDIVGLGRESDEEPRKLADTRQSGRGHGHSGAGERIVAARVKKDDVHPLALAEFSEHGVERNHPRGEVVDLAQFGADGNEVVAPAELQTVPGVVEKRHIRIGRLQCEFVDGALHGRQTEINLECDLEAERLQRRGDVFSVVRRIGERRNGFVGAVADDERKPALRPRRQGREAEDDGEKRRCRPPPCPAQRLGRRRPSNQRASPIDWLKSAGVYQSDGGSVESAGDHIAIPKLPAARLGILRKNESDLLVNGRDGLMEHGDGLAA